MHTLFPLATPRAPHFVDLPSNDFPCQSSLATNQMTILTTPRLRLEPFQDAHLAGLNALSSDPQVMRYITGKP